MRHRLKISRPTKVNAAPDGQSTHALAQVDTSQGAVKELRELQLGVAEPCAAKASERQVRPLQDSPGQIGALEVDQAQFGEAQVGSGQVCPLEGGGGEVCVMEQSPAQVCRCKIHQCQVEPSEINFPEIPHHEGRRGRC